MYHLQTAAFRVKSQFPCIEPSLKHLYVIKQYFVSELPIFSHPTTTFTEFLNPLPPGSRCRSGTEKKYFRSSFQFSTVTIQKISPPGNLKFNYSGVFQTFKLRLSMKKNFQCHLSLISLQILWAVMG